jgi:hypothetical protein
MVEVLTVLLPVQETTLSQKVEIKVDPDSIISLSSSLSASLVLSFSSFVDTTTRKIITTTKDKQKEEKVLAHTIEIKVTESTQKGSGLNKHIFYKI